ncbi:FN3 associated domain-containing protein [Verrucomicrobium spinosum]|uniref:FN3 associated domain-containing protein n=1 Tax=Verrucomicrobium spinosum TaxID=2736 RepID=UPI0009463DD4|nr:FN3 associated domain-containing protein [Verrucomicrobium spinosum]
MNILQQLQLDVGGYLGTLGQYQYVPITVVRPRDAGAATLIQTNINNAGGDAQEERQGRHCGHGADASAGVPVDKVKGFLRIELTVRIIENPLVNEGAEGTHVPAEQLALDTLMYLHGWDAGRKHEFRGDESNAVRAANIVGKVAYDVTVYCYHGADNAQQVAVPVMTVGGGDITLTCAAASAEIWYTLDGSFPGPSNAEAVEYEAAFASVPGAVLRAAAYKGGNAPSDVLERILS